MDNLAARQAVAYAVDQALISEAIFGGVETAAETLFDPAKPYCDVDVKTYPTTSRLPTRCLTRRVMPTRTATVCAK